MGTLLWLAFTTLLGGFIESGMTSPSPFTEFPSWVGPTIGFAVGVILRLIAAGISGESLGDIADFSDGGGSYGGGDGGSCGGD